MLAAPAVAAFVGKTGHAAPVAEYVPDYAFRNLVDDGSFASTIYAGTGRLARVCGRHGSPYPTWGP